MQFYVSGKSYVMRDTGKMSSLDSPDWSNSTPYKVSEETFVGKFGGKPLGICNYIVEDDTVLEVASTSGSRTVYTRSATTST